MTILSSEGEIPVGRELGGEVKEFNRPGREILNEGGEVYERIVTFNEVIKRAVFFNLTEERGRL